MQGLRALIVDDNSTNREILGHQLLAAGVVHEEADCGAGALEKLRAAAMQGKPFDIAVTDEDMPGMDGIALAHAVRSDPLLAATRLIMLSSLGREGAAPETGIAYCLTRPVRQSQLFDCLVSAMAGTTCAPVVRQAQPAPAANLQAHVLLVEDHPVNQELALHMLEMLGCRAVVANHGREALEALDRTAFDLILMDCQMPEMDGFEATAEIRRREAARINGRRIPIVALTAGAVDGDREKCLAAGMDDYVTKPFSFDQFERALRRWLPAADPVAKSTPCIDVQVLERMRALRGNGGSDLAAKVIGVYLNDAPGRLRSLQEAVARGDTVAMGRTAHAFKSASANLGATTLAELCQRMESLGRTSSMSGVDGLLAEIETAYALAAAELSAHMGNTRS
jgi:CheY-like chemotaxis protein/HPt (histidine-containing phosphotransfer) domain-containing protein